MVNFTIGSDLADTAYMLHADVTMLPVAQLSVRDRALLGYSVGEDQVSLSRPGSRVTTRLISPQLAALLAEFREPSRLTDAVLRFSRSHGRDPLETLDNAFEALSQLIGGRFLLPSGSPGVGSLQPSMLPGQVVAGYEILGIANSLEDTEVYKARSDSGSRIALKLARPAAPEWLERGLATEAEILRHLGGVVSPALVESGEYDGRSFIAMEWRAGVPISSAAQKLRASSDRRQLHQLGRRLLDAYAVIHGRRVVHGDIHPGNVIAAVDGAVTVLDFGRARWIQPGVAGHGGESSLVDPTRAGVPYYYEPEMALALLNGALPPPATVRGEQFSLAALLYELITGVHYVDFRPEQDQLLSQIVRLPPLPFSARGIAPWTGTERVLARALAKAAAERYRDVAEFSAAFAREPVVNAPRDAPRRAPAADDLLAACLREAIDGTEVAGATRSANPAEVAYFAYRGALARDDADLLAGADARICRSNSRSGRDWYDHAVAAFVHHARGDRSTEQQAAAEFLSTCEHLAKDIGLLGGRCGALIAASQLVRNAVAHEVDPGLIALWAQRTLDGLWQEIEGSPAIADCTSLPHLGMAHGWAGLLYATVSACSLIDISYPRDLLRRLDELASLAQPFGRGLRWPGTLPRAGTERQTLAQEPGWCSGSAGFVWLWGQAFEALGEQRFLNLATRAGFCAVDHATSNPDLCCGTTGQGFAALRLYQLTGDLRWLAHSRRLANLAATQWNGGRSLPGFRKGRLGTALLLIENEAPENVLQPLFRPLEDAASAADA